MKQLLSQLCVGISFTILFIFLLPFASSFVPAASNIMINDAEARARGGRRAAPRASPHHVSGVHRRTVVRHSTHRARVYRLPAGCASVTRHGRRYHHCGGVYYRPYYEGTTVVYVIENS